MAKNITIVNKNINKFFLCVGFGISKSDLKDVGEEFEFSSNRERKEFRSILESTKPTSIEVVRDMYRSFKNRSVY